MQRRKTLAVGALVALSLVASACSKDKSSDTTAAPAATTAAAAETTAAAAETTAAAAETTAAAAAETTAAAAETAAAADTTVAAAAAATGEPGTAGGKIKCDGQYKGKSVTVFSPNDDAKDIATFEAGWAPFEKCTGVDVKWEGSKTFEADVKLRLAGGNAPDVIDFPQPGLLATQAQAGKLKELPADIGQELKDHFLSGWAEYGTVDGKLYGSAYQSNFKSFVWYSPEAFKAKGYTVPTTLEEMVALSDKIVADGGTPWCAGIESGAATGWVITDWVEDMMLRLNSPADYDAWVNHTLPFNDPKVAAAVDAVGAILKNPKYVGNVKAIATTRFQDGGLPILDGKCYMHRQATFYKTFWPEGTTFGDSAKINAFYLPPAKAGDPKVMLGGGDINAATNDKPETFDTIRFMSSLEFQNTSAKDAAKFSPRKDYDTSLFSDPLNKFFADAGKNADVFRFDGSDLMPGAVGAGSFWKEATSWITGESTTDMLNNIEKSWPAS